MNKILYYGDNLPVLRAYFQDESVDLIYLDPPFNSKANYNIFFGDKSGKDSAAQVEAFKDSWQWTEEAEKAYQVAINLIKGRLYGEYNIHPKPDYNVIGEPVDLEGAIALSEQDRYQFQWWALSLINARPFGDKKKGSDKGIDGFIYFTEYPENKTEKAIVQVKSGKVKSGDIRDLKGVVEREQAAFGIFITLQEPSKDMLEEATTSGFWKNRPEYPKLQIFTIKEILNGSKVKIPFQVYHSQEAHKVGKKIQRENYFRIGGHILNTKWFSE